MTTTDARTKTVAGPDKAPLRKSRRARRAAALLYLAIALSIASLVAWQVAAFLN